MRQSRAYDRWCVEEPSAEALTLSLHIPCWIGTNYNSRKFSVENNLQEDLSA